MMDLSALEQQYGLPKGLLSAVMNQESGGNPNAISPKGAMGAFQFMPATAQQYGIDPNDPNQAAQGAARMFGDLSQKYNGDVPSMLAGYNWGQGNVDRKGMGNAPPETRNYVSNIMAKLPAQGTQYADSGAIMTDAVPDAPPTMDVRLPNGQLIRGIPQGTTKEQLQQKLAANGINVDEGVKPKDTSFISNFGQSAINAANEGRLGFEGLAQSLGKALYGANPQDASEEAGRLAALEQIKQETANSGVVPSGFAGTAGNIAGSIAGNPTSWTPLGEINGISGLAKAGAKIGALSGLIENDKNNSLSEHLLNAGIGGAEGAAGAAFLGVGGKAIGELPAGIVNRVKGAFADSPADMAAQSEKNWEDAGNLFKSSTANGAIINNNSAQNIFEQIKNAVGNLSSRHTDTAGVIADFEKTLENGNITPDKFHDFRQDLNDVISTNTKSKIDGGGINADGQKAMAAKSALDEALAGLTEKDLSAGTPQAISDMQNGINSTAKAYRYDRISEMLKDAQGDPNAIMRGAAKLQKSMKGLNGDEAAALEDLATRGTGQAIERALGTFGFDFGKVKNVALPAITSGTSAVVPGGIPLMAAGTIMRQTGKWGAKGKGQNLLDTIMERDTTPSAPSITSKIFKVQQRVKEASAPVVKQGITSDYFNPKSKDIGRNQAIKKRSMGAK